jgi:hypothetical protein
VSGYGTCTWTCGRCGETYSASGVVGDIKVDRWARDHREEHRVDDMTPEERAEWIRGRMRAVARFG